MKNILPVLIMGWIAVVSADDEVKAYIAIDAHRSEYAVPLTVDEAEQVIVGELYKGPEGWNNWVWCTTSVGTSGWVPQQFITLNEEGTVGKMNTAYTSRELHVDVNEPLVCGVLVNGWRWCESRNTLSSGWVPDKILRETHD